MEVKAIAKKWGSSIGIIIPKEVVDAKRIKENDKITIEIKTRPLAGEMFGMLKGWRIDAQKVKDDIRKEEKMAEERKWKQKK